MKTNNPFIAAACDQAGEVCELVQSLTAPAKRPVNCGTSYCSCIECHFPSPAWCASVDAELAATEEADADAGLSQHAHDSKELRRLCQERDDLRKAIGLHNVDIAALESSVGHLSTLVDELRRLLGAAMQTMTELHGSAAPDESTADIDARIPGAAFAKFVNEHAQLLFEIKNGCAATPATTLPAAAVAEGAQLDGESLEPSE